VNSNRNIGIAVALIGACMGVWYIVDIARLKYTLKDEQEQHDIDNATVGDFSVILHIS
jgi:hypothetical protein